MNPDRLLSRLVGAEVPFVIIGGMAAVLHGSTLLTRDLDICIPLGSENVLRLQSALAELNPRVRAGAGWIPLALEPAQAAAIRNLYIQTDEGRLDCLGDVAGVGDFGAVLAVSVELTLDTFSCRVIGLDALIRAKEAIGRPHDIETVIQLKALRERQGG